ncbi:AAA family ATPase [Fimbriiglobus ruber]|uniref:ATP binding protein n=1 Tax=Fimbriiglobus ruber TaxID=1908690 RepID=A0A225E0G1_9BACT|nr:AAA family ATPase [Fimbriiglobus ruber]OWK45294.1 ATP binding protein [Fimbriiglobus ruber]
MRIDALSLQNFCCFENRQFQLAERFNLLIGDNGSGKTSILDGLAVGLGSLFLGLRERIAARPIHREEIRFRPLTAGETHTREEQFPVVVSCDGVVNGQSGTWRRELKAADSHTTRQDAKWIESVALTLDEHVRGGRAIVLPVISYYGTGRLWYQKRPKAIDPLSPASRFQGYRDCLDPASDEKRLLAWFKTQEIQSLQQKKSIGVLEAVRQAILACVEGATHVWFDVAQDELLLRFPDRVVPIYYLSDGYRNMLAMVADIAIRCATLNPAMKKQAIRDTPGVVLIDEIDLHLHPKWQRRVVTDLLAAFPKIQFVATTHSPFIIQSLVPKDGIKLLNLDKPEADDFADKSVEDIAENVQGVDVPSRSLRYQDMMETAEQYYRTLRRTDTVEPEQLEQLKDRLDELASRFSDDPAYHAILKVEREARLGQNGVHNAPR